MHTYALSTYMYLPACYRDQNMKSFTATVGNKAGIRLVLSGDFVNDRHLAADKHYHRTQRLSKAAFVMH
jgi:hypothetical protein